jgi:pyruvate dehydrogenase E2 component (dihydrolipoamide acetyltransferase)
MAQIIGLPKLSPTMEEGILVRWVKKEGDKVQPGDLIAEVETDKANMDFNLEDEGVLLKLLVKEGDTVKLGAPVAILGEEGEDVSKLVSEAGAGGGVPAGAKEERKQEAAPADDAKPVAEPKAKAAEKPAAKPAPAKAKAQKEPEATDEAETQKVEKPAKAKPAGKKSENSVGGARGGDEVSTRERESAGGGKLLASPLAKSLAIELGVDLRQVKGSGPGGRIVERDVKAAAAGVAEPEYDVADHEATAVTPLPDLAEVVDGPPPAGSEESATRAIEVFKGKFGPLALQEASDEYVDKPLTAVRKTIASRLSQAKREMPHYRLTATVDAGPLADFRQRLNQLLGDRGKVSFNDLILKGAALALRRVPECNAAFMGDSIRYYTRVHMGFAVALETGLITPIIRNADLKGIGVISAEVRDLVDRGKRRQLKAHEIQGATFTVSNLGMFGIDQFDAIINPPAACILAVGRIQRIPVVENDRIVIGDRLNLTMSCDHRAVDGALGARYMDELRDIIERPESLAL